MLIHFLYFRSSKKNNHKMTMMRQKRKKRSSRVDKQKYMTLISVNENLHYFSNDKIWSMKRAFMIRTAVPAITFYRYIKVKWDQSGGAEETKAESRKRKKKSQRKCMIAYRISVGCIAFPPPPAEKTYRTPHVLPSNQSVNCLSRDIFVLFAILSRAQSRAKRKP